VFARSAIGAAEGARGRQVGEKEKRRGERSGETVASRRVVGDARRRSIRRQMNAYGVGRDSGAGEAGGSGGVPGSAGGGSLPVGVGAIGKVGANV
jgi:hypothetical protein